MIQFQLTTVHILRIAVACVVLNETSVIASLRMIHVRACLRACLRARAHAHIHVVTTIVTLNPGTRDHS